MIQAAGSGKQNIIEGSQASGTSRETEIKLTNVARASLEELLGDYRDFPRLRGIAEWPPGHSHSRRLRQLETAFVREGGLRERMTRARLTERKVRAQGNSS